MKISSIQRQNCVILIYMHCCINLAVTIPYCILKIGHEMLLTEGGKEKKKTL